MLQIVMGKSPRAADRYHRRTAWQSVVRRSGWQQDWEGDTGPQLHRVHRATANEFTVDIIAGLGGDLWLTQNQLNGKIAVNNALVQCPA